MNKKTKSQPVNQTYLDKVLKKQSEENQKEHQTILEVIKYGFDENKKEHQRLEKKFDDTWDKIDKYVKAQESFRQEFVIMKEEIRQIKTVIKEKLGVEIRAI